MSLLFPSVANIILTARIWKNLPLLFIFLSGIVIGGKPQDVVMVIAGVLGISFSSAFMTHLNIVTDRELDLIEKPHLYKMLSSNKMVMNMALSIEFVVSFICVLFFIWKGHLFTAIMLFVFNIVTILYSYNFFSRHPQKNRLKVFWYGHFIILILGYLSLWYAGYLLTGLQSEAFKWFPLFLGISLSEYALFLFESSVDQKDEKKFNLKTLSALLGTRKTTYVAIGLSVIGLIVITLGISTAPKLSLLWYAFFPISGFILVFLIIVSYKRLYLKSETFKVPDLIFNLGRIYILLSCTYLNLIQ